MNSLIDQDGTGVEVLTAKNKKKKSVMPALFLDRDGTIVEEVSYLHRPKDVTLIPGAAQVIRTANKKNMPVIIVTNQAGIGRGYYDWTAFHAVQNLILEILASKNAFIDAVFACPFHLEGKGSNLVKNHPDRKPNPGMLLKAQESLSIDLQNSWIVGDRQTDLGAGHAANCKGGVHVLTGHGSENGEAKISRTFSSENFQVIICKSISEICQHIPTLRN